MSVTRADELVDALAERVEKLTGLNREIDALIFETVTGVSAHRPAVGFSGRAVTRRMQEMPSYTSSLDAAMSLLGDNAIEQFSWWPRAPKEHQSEICCRVRLMGIQPSGWGDFSRKVEVKAATPALALTAACLRAQASALRDREAGR